MKIRIEMEHKELYSYAELASEVDSDINVHEFVGEVSKNMRATSKMVSLTNTRNDANNSVVTEMTIEADLIVKIARKMMPIISACKMIVSMITNFFEDITDDIGESDVWIEGEDDEEESNEDETTHNE